VVPLIACAHWLLYDYENVSKVFNSPFSGLLISSIQEQRGGGKDLRGASETSATSEMW
jgi:hypothetical protein